MGPWRKFVARLRWKTKQGGQPNKIPEEKTSPVEKTVVPVVKPAPVAKPPVANWERKHTVENNNVRVVINISVQTEEIQKTVPVTDQNALSRCSWRDVPGQYYSPSLRKLVSFEAEKMKLSDPGIWALTAFNKFQDSLIWMNRDSDSKFYFFFQHAHLAMSRHLYGPSYGIPLDALAVHKQRSFGKTCVWSRTLTPAIIDDEMYLQARHRVYHPGRSSAELLESFRAEGPEPKVLSPCAHRSGSTTDIIRELLNDRTYVRTGEATPIAWHCKDCLTDWNVTIVHEGNRGWYLEIMAYHQLGSCRSPLDWKWRSFAGYPGTNISGRNELGFAYNDVKKRWEEHFLQNGRPTLLESPGPYLKENI